ncbi:MAG: ABC transporter ATP-binding protein, partial [Malacoplasma sp.]|nr:ABC transporter ATP-binding protein [Malacoplasma sp.]
MKRKDVYLAFFCLFLSICQVACDISQPFLLTELSNSISTTDLGQIWTFAGGMIGLAVASFIIGSAITFVSARLAVRVGGNIRFELFNKVQNLTGAELDKLTTASLITRITNDVTFYQNTLVLVLRMLMRSTLIFIGGIIASFVYSSQLQSNVEFGEQSLWWLAFIIIGCLFVLMLIMSVLITFSIPFFGKQQKETDKTNAVMRENILGIKVVKAFNLQQEQIEVFDKQNKSLRYVSTRGQQIGMSLMPLIQFFVQISIVALLMVSAVMMERSGAGQTEGTVLSFIQMVSLISMGMILSIIAIVNLAQTKACSNRILEVFNTQRSIPRNTSNNVIEDSSVEFKN